MGSWHPQSTAEIWAAQGGRLLTTSLAAMTLAVNYRHLPMYRPPPLARRNQPPDSVIMPARN
jgi:hypothetical protein